jgi:hypothetical protein
MREPPKRHAEDKEEQCEEHQPERFDDNSIGRRFPA